MAHNPPAIIVPDLIASPADVSRLRRELEALDEHLRQAALREAGEGSLKLPRTSRLLDELASSNQLNLLETATRQNLAGFLADIAQNAPVVTISFASDPSSAFLAKIVHWFRENVHPSVLVRVGLQPNIAAGCVVRTTNRYFDLSLRQHFQQNRQHLLAALEGQTTA